MKKIGELNARVASFVLYYDEADIMNHYKLYQKWYDDGWHRKLIMKHPHLRNCVAWINNYIWYHDEEGR